MSAATRSWRPGQRYSLYHVAFFIYAYERSHVLDRWPDEDERPE